MESFHARNKLHTNRRTQHHCSLGLFVRHQKHQVLGRDIEDIELASVWILIADGKMVTGFHHNGSIRNAVEYASNRFDFHDQLPIEKSTIFFFLLMFTPSKYRSEISCPQIPYGPFEDARLSIPGMFLVGPTAASSSL